MDEYYSIGERPRSSSPALELLTEAVTSIPDAAADLAMEAWAHPLDTATHVAKTVGTSAALGTALGAFIPAKGPAGLMAGAVFTVPLVLGEYDRFKGVFDKAYEPGADFSKLGHELAKGTISDTANIGLCFAGGSLGARLGHRLATSDTALGSSLQQIQRKIIKGENQALMALDNIPDLLRRQVYRTPEPLNAEGLSATPQTGKRAWFAPNNELISNRLAQLQAAEGAAGVPTLQEYYGHMHGHSRYSDGTGLPKDIYKSAKEGGQKFYSITDHNHLAARDGVKPSDPRSADQAGTPILASNPIEYSQTFADAMAASESGKFVGLVGVEMGTIGKVGGGKKPGGAGATKSLLDSGHDHVHDHGHSHGAEGADHAHVHAQQNYGVGNGPEVVRVFQPDGRVEVHTINQQAVTGNTTSGLPTEQFLKPQPNGKPLGEQSNAIGPTQPNGQSFPNNENLLDSSARAASHYGGVNHINLFEVPQFFEAIRQPRTQPQPKGFLGTITSPFRRMFSSAETVEVKAPEVIKYNDGDYKAMVDHLDKLTDTTGKRPVIQLNHPRFSQDWDTRLDPSVRGRDYGIKSFKDLAEWRERFGKYASQIEVITGEALSPNPNQGPVKTNDLGPINMAGYLDKGLHLSPTFGRDDHFALPNASPAGTGILAEALTKEGLLDAMRARRTVATTSTELLQGHMVVNDSHPMGTIFDQSAVNDLNIKMKVGGNLDPKAKYKVSLYGDEKIGDGTLAKAVQVKQLTGQDLLDTHGQVMFDQVHHKIGNSSAWYVEVQRTDAKTANVDYLWTAPVWVEPLAGQHSWLTKGLVGAGSHLLLSSTP